MVSDVTEVIIYSEIPTVAIFDDRESTKTGTYPAYYTMGAPGSHLLMVQVAGKEQCLHCWVEGNKERLNSSVISLSSCIQVDQSHLSNLSLCLAPFHHGGSGV